MLHQAVLALVVLLGIADVGGPSASRYFFIVLLCMPNSLSIARRDIPLRLAFSTAFHLAFWRNVGFRAGLTGDLSAGGCTFYGRAAFFGVICHRVQWCKSLAPAFCQGTRAEMRYRRVVE